MRTKHRKMQILLLGALTSFVSAATGQPANTVNAPPDFSLGLDMAWVGIGVGELHPVPAQP